MNSNSPISNYLNDFQLELKLFKDKDTIFDNLITKFKKQLFDYGKDITNIFSNENENKLFNFIKSKFLLLNYNLIFDDNINISYIDGKQIEKTRKNDYKKEIQIEFKNKKNENIIINYKLTLIQKSNKIILKIFLIDETNIDGIQNIIKNNLIEYDIFELINHLEIYKRITKEYSKIKDIHKKDNKILKKKYKQILIYNFLNKSEEELKKSKLVTYNESIGSYNCNYINLLTYINNEKNIKKNESKIIRSYSFDFIYMLNIIKNLFILLNFLKQKIYFILFNEYVFEKDLELKSFELLFDNYFKYYYDVNINIDIKNFDNDFFIVLNNKKKLKKNYSKIILGSFNFDNINFTKSKISNLINNNLDKNLNSLKLYKNEDIINNLNDILNKYTKFGLIKINSLNDLLNDNNLFVNIKKQLDVYKDIFNKELFNKNNTKKDINSILCKILNYYLVLLKKSVLLKFICFTKNNNLNKLYCNLGKILKNKKDLYIGYFTIDLTSFYKTNFISYKNFKSNNLNKNLNTIFPSNFVRLRNNTIKIDKDLLLISINDNYKKNKESDKFKNIIHSYIQRIQPFLIVICIKISKINKNFNSPLKNSIDDTYNFFSHISKNFKTIIYYKKDSITNSFNNKKLLIKNEKESESITNKSIYYEIIIESNNKSKKFIFINSNDKLKNLIYEYNLINKFNDNFNIFLLGNIGLSKDIIKSYMKKVNYDKKNNINSNKNKKIINKEKNAIKKEKEQKVFYFFEKLNKSIKNQLSINKSNEKSIFYIPQDKELIIRDIKKIVKINKNREIDTPDNPICLKVNLKL